MAKSKSKQTPISNHFPIGFFTISYQPFFPRGAKRKLRDENGKLIYNLENSRITTGHIFSEYDVDNAIKYLNEQGYKKIKKNELTIDLPRKCPVCGELGSPSKRKDTRFKLKDQLLDDIEKNKQNQNYILKYTHSKSPETCHVGYIDFSKNGIQIKLNKKILKNTLPYSGRIGTYPL